MRRLFIEGWPDSKWADQILSVQWQEDHQDIVRLVVVDMNTVYYLPSGTEVFPIPAGSSRIKDKIDHVSQDCHQREESTGSRP